MNQILTFFKTKDLYLGVVRYSLGLCMLPYAFSKIMRTQFVLMPSQWNQTLESLPGRNLAWAFLGHSTWFQMLIGFLELIPALLLLFRRTTLLGAILMLPMTLNVFFINYALQLWDGTKTISSVLLVLNCVVLVFEWKRIKIIMLLILGFGKKLNLSLIELAVNTVILYTVSTFALHPILGYKSQRNALTGDWLNQHPIEWTLQTEKLNDSILQHRLMKSYFAPYGKYSEIRQDNYASPSEYRFNEHKHTLTFIYHGNSQHVIYNYKMLGDTGIQLERTVDSAKNIKLSQVFVKRIMQLTD